MHVAAFLVGSPLCSAPHAQPTAQSLLLMAGLEFSLWEPECCGLPACLPASGPGVIILCWGTPRAEWLRW